MCSTLLVGSELQLFQHIHNVRSRLYTVQCRIRSLRSQDDTYVPNDLSRQQKDVKGTTKSCTYIITNTMTQKIRQEIVYSSKKENI